MEKEFIPYEQALELKELGFDEECFGEYFQIGHHFGQLVTSNEELDIQLTSIFECGAPLYQQVFRWFREKFGIDVFPCKTNNYYFAIYINDELYVESNGIKPLIEGETYEEAELECLKKLIELCEKNQ